MSTATVSRALSNPELLSDPTRDAVFAAIRTTGYRVNRSARNLRTRRAGAVLVLVPNLGNPFFSQILSGLSQTFAGTEYSVLILDTNHLPADDTGLVDYFLDSRIDGMISLDGGLSQKALALFEKYGAGDRIVSACEWVAGASIPSVRSDNEKGARLAMRHLHDLGHRRIAHVSGPEDNVLTHARRDGVLAACADLGLCLPPDWMIGGDFTLRAGRDAAARILAAPGADRPTAVFCASDEMAFGLIAGLSEGGLSVPGDVSVVGFDDIEHAAFFVPSLTTVRQDRLALGRRSAERLLRRLNGTPSDDDDAVDLVDVGLIVRGSSAAPGQATK